MQCELLYGRPAKHHNPWAWDPLVDAWPALVLHGSCKAKLCSRPPSHHHAMSFPLLLAGWADGRAGWLARRYSSWLAGSLLAGCHHWRSC